MNGRIFRAFWFEHLTRTWPFLLSAPLVPIVSAAMMIAYSDEYNGLEVAEIYIPMLGVAFPLQAIALLYNGGIRDSLSCGIPDSTLRLPVPSGAIVFGRFTFNIAVMTLMTAAFYAPLPLMLEPWILLAWGNYQPLLYYIAVIAGLISVLQLVALATSGTGDWTIAFLAATTIIYLVVNSVLTQMFADGVVAFHLVIVAGSFIGTWLTLHLMRSGTIQSPISLGAGTESRSRRSSSRPFKSARSAQLWFEMRRIWQPFSRVFIVLAVLSFLVTNFPNDLPMPGLDGSNWENLPESAASKSLHRFASIILFSAGIASLLAGTIVAIENRRTQLGSMAAFLYLRPMSTAQLADARITAAIRILLLPAFAIAISFAAYDFMASVSIAVNDEYQPTLLNFAAAYAIVLLPVIAFIWLAFWTWNLIAIGILYTGLGALLVLASASTVVSVEEVPYVLAYFAIVGVGWIAMYVFVIVKRLSRLKLSLGLPVVVLGLILVFATASGHIYQREVLPGEFMYVVPFFMMLLAPVATIPLALQWTRHR